MLQVPRRWCLAAAMLVALGSQSPAADAQQQNVEPTVASTPPFHVGERLTYQVKYGRIPVGHATMTVVGVEDVRGRPSYHVAFAIDGGLPGLQVHDRYESWLDTATLAS